MLLYFETDDLEVVKNETTILKNRVISYNTPIREWIASCEEGKSNVLYGTEVFNPSDAENFALDHLVLAYNHGMIFSDKVKSTFNDRNKTLTFKSDHLFPAFVSEIDGAMNKIPTAYDNIMSRADAISKVGVDYIGPLLVSPRYILDYDGDPLDLFMDIVSYGPHKLSWCDVGISSIGTSGDLSNIFTSFTYPVHDGSVVDYSSYPGYNSEHRTIDGIPVPLHNEGTTMYEGKYIHDLLATLGKE